MLNKSYQTLNFLKKALDGSWTRNKVISNNIANVNTPGYKKKSVNFEEQLKRELSQKNSVSMMTTNDKHISTKTTSHLYVKEHKNYSTRKDKNNVNIDKQMANMTKNNIMYNSLLKQVSYEFNEIKDVITGGGQ